MKRNQLRAAIVGAGHRAIRYASYAHQDQHIESYLKALNETFSFIARAIENSKVEKLLKGPVAQSGFHRLI